MKLFSLFGYLILDRAMQYAVFFLSFCTLTMQATEYAQETDQGKLSALALSLFIVEVLLMTGFLLRHQLERQ